MAVEPDHGQIVLRVLLLDLALPRAAACPLQRHEAAEIVLDHMPRGDQVARAVVLPADEPGAGARSPSRR